MKSVRYSIINERSRFVILYVAYSYVRFNRPCGLQVAHVARRLPMTTLCNNPVNKGRLCFNNGAAS